MLGGLGLDPSQMMGLDPAVILDDLFNATTELQIAVYLKKMYFLKNVIRGFARFAAIRSDLFRMAFFAGAAQKLPM